MIFCDTGVAVRTMRSEKRHQLFEGAAFVCLPLPMKKFPTFSAAFHFAPIFRTGGATDQRLPRSRQNRECQFRTNPGSRARRLHERPLRNDQPKWLRS